MKILLIEDEEELSEIVCSGLRKSGYAVDAAYDGNEALDFYGVYEYDVIILDLNLPKLDGFEVLRSIREHDNKTKILILSARDAVEDRVKGLDMGANDYLTKPFDFLELEARIRTLCRIAYVQVDNVMTCGEISLNMATQEVFFASVKIATTKKEYGVLEYMLLHKNQCVEAEKLLNHVWDNEADFYPDALKYHIHRLKKKLADAGCKEDMIQNVHGVGYMVVGN